jgi:hypothetical protein
MEFKYKGKIENVRMDCCVYHQVGTVLAFKQRQSSVLNHRF